MALRPPPETRDARQRLEFGVVNLDKPAGPTSHQVSAWVRSLADAERTGHAGTLDPGVTGCLPVMIGTATRLTPALSAGRKAYVVVVEFHDEPSPRWGAIADRFTGPIYQRPPRKSAVRRTMRVRTIHDIEILEETPRRALLAVECEAGTYVRKLCHDLGLAIGTGAHMVALRRIESEPFDDTSLVTLHDLADALAWWREDGTTDALETAVLPAEAALAHLPKVTIEPTAAENVATGAPIYRPGIVEGLPEAGRLVGCYTPDGSAVCLGRTVDPEERDGIAVDLERVLV